MQVTDSVGSVSGFVSHLGGSVCPEHSSSNWDVTVVNRAVLSQIVTFDQIPIVEKEKLNLISFFQLKIMELSLLLKMLSNQKDLE